MTNTADYITDDAQGNGWRLLLGDSCERLAELPDESIDMSVCSPPFDSLFTYSPSVRDLGNSASRADFLDHYRYIVEHQLRLTKPGRIACIHVQQLTTSKATHGHVGMTDFRGDVIRLFQGVGWIFHGETTVWKDPQAQSIRTKSFSLAFQTKNRDSASSRPALADYLLIFRKPGENAVKIAHQADSGEVTKQRLDRVGLAGLDRRHRRRVAHRRRAPVASLVRHPRVRHPQRQGGPRGRRRAPHRAATTRVHPPMHPALLQSRRDRPDAVRWHRVRAVRRAQERPMRDRMRVEAELLANGRRQPETTRIRAEYPDAPGRAGTGRLMPQ